MKNKISPQELQRLLSYDPFTGVLTWRERTPDMFKEGKNSREHSCARWNTRFAGKDALACISHGYMVGDVYSTRFSAHRVVWAVHYGSWPIAHIDHINGERADNRIENLRDVTPSENSRNAKICARNLSGVTGVNWSKSASRWISHIGVSGKCKHIGCFVDFNDAVKARQEAEEKYGYHENHGRTE
jgi:hypothetical protein